MAKADTLEVEEEELSIGAQAALPSGEIPQSVFDLAYLRRSQEDLKIVLETLNEHGTVTIVPDPEPPEAEQQPEEPEVEE